MGQGPLGGVRVVELAGIGPGPFAAMLLADLGADVVRVDRPAHVSGAQTTAGRETGGREAAAGGGPTPGRETGGREAAAGGGPNCDVLARGRRSVAVDLKNPRGAALLLDLLEDADVLVEGFRPGVAERLGVGPEVCLTRNPGLIYGRMTGWGQEGPRAPRAGHDLDYIALAGALHPIGPADRPPPVPLNYVGDFGGGGMLLALGVVCGLVERAASGRGQVVDAAMVDGAALQTAMFHGLLAAGLWRDEREDNLLDGGAPFYRTYACADGAYVAVGALEPQFFAELLDRLGLDPDTWPQHDRSRWPEQREALAEIFASRTREAWVELFDGTDACVAPVLSLTEAPTDEHMRARATFVELGGVLQPAPAPRFSRTPATLQRPPAAAGAHTDEILSELGLDAADRQQLREQGVVA